MSASICAIAALFVRLNKGRAAMSTALDENLRIAVTKEAAFMLVAGAVRPTALDLKTEGSGLGHAQVSKSEIVTVIRFGPCLAAQPFQSGTPPRGPPDL